MEQKTKETFFNELYQLGDDESGEEDLSNVDLILRQSKSVVDNSLLHSSRPTQALGRTVSAPLPQSLAPNNDQAHPSADALFSSTMSRNVFNDILIDQTPQTVKQARNTTKLKNGGKVNGKRKRGNSLGLMPESQQIFKGLTFYFFPNNDIAPSRGFRIRKAVEWGALWTKEWKSGITHVVVDKEIGYKDLLHFLNVTKIPPDIALVNETYPSDCIIYRFLVNTNQPQYRVTGHEEAHAASHSPPPAPSFGTFLQLKPEKGEVTKAQQTPSRTEGSDPESFSQSHHEAASQVVNLETGKKTRPHSEQPRNALDKAIEETMAIKDLPLDFDEDNDLGNMPVLHDLKGGDSEDEKITRSKPKASFNKSWQTNFSCMSKHDGTTELGNPNARTIELLQKMADYYEGARDHWRLTAYRRAIAALRKKCTKITTASEAFAIPFVGERLADKIEEIVWTHRLRRLDNTRLEPNDDVFLLFLKIYGVGRAQATKWIDQGHRTIDDLLTKVQLTKNQKIGIEHLDDFQSRIPRHEMDRHDQYMRETCSNIDATIQFTIGGSYRRGAPDSRDIDFIVTKPDCPIELLRTIMLERVIPKLFGRGYLKVGLATTAREHGSKWHGAAALPGTSIWRRIDFLLVPWEELGAALIYFTGNDVFNRSMRLLASKKGMRLNQRGLWKDVIRGNSRERVTQGSLVESKDEKRIFEHLGVPWRPPHHRIC